MPDEKSWSYNGGKSTPITAKKSGGLWEVYIDGKKTVHYIPTDAKLESIVQMLQTNYVEKTNQINYTELDRIIGEKS